MANRGWTMHRESSATMTCSTRNFPERRTGRLQLKAVIRMMMSGRGAETETSEGRHATDSLERLDCELILLYQFCL